MGVYINPQLVYALTPSCYHFPPVQELVDGELVVFHDATVTRAFSVSGANVARLKAMGFDATTPLWSLTYKQLLTLDVGGRRGVKVPTLAAMLDLLRDQQVCSRQYTFAVPASMCHSHALADILDCICVCIKRRPVCV